MPVAPQPASSGKAVPVGLSAQSRNLWLAAMLHRQRADALAAAEPREARP